ncbi:hypothetical protein, partial [Thiolapillus sp.]|uniref:hypothetical protein n=1 Tax=Thiolapillus sp. TaxID=2017437 RepID=UPI003AF5B3B2
MSYPISLITCPSPFELGVVPVSPDILGTSRSVLSLSIKPGRTFLTTLKRRLIVLRPTRNHFPFR